ncbi:polyol transporter 5-like [Eucalyptus grandis]|uniref:polyol transporter 5-like n=1 Tax=Eucalyptus grandis TaxID=71139 RepID=UPI00192EC946|nr:polyol transporter 5-like [Eucalyptus grandis]
MSKGIVYIKPDQQTNDEFEDHLMGVSKLSSPIGLILAWWIPNKIGYHCKIGLVASIFFVGALIVTIKDDYFILVVGRFIINIVATYTLIIIPIYIAEITPVSYRGLLTSFLRGRIKVRYLKLKLKLKEGDCFLIRVLVVQNPLDGLSRRAVGAMRNISLPRSPTLRRRLQSNLPILRTLLGSLKRTMTTSSRSPARAIGGTSDIELMSKGIVYTKPDQQTNDEFEDHLMGVSKLSSPIGLILVWWIPDKIDYHCKIGLVASIFFIGALIVTIKDDYFILVVGRFIINIVATYTLIIIPIYIAEITPISYRGLLTSFLRIHSNLGWRLLLSIRGIPFLLIFWVFVMPESPRWLIMQGRQRDAKRILAQISNSKEEATVQLVKIKEAVGIHEENNDDIINVTSQGAWGDIWWDLH